MCDALPVADVISEDRREEVNADRGDDVVEDKEEEGEPSSPVAQVKQPMHRGVVYGSASVFLGMLGAAVTFPFLQAQRDKLECDVLCYGSMQSVRSGLTLVGSVLVGRMSDRMGRSRALWIGNCASLLSFLINWKGQTVTAMWIAMVPSCLLNQNFTVLKALFADYNEEAGGSESSRASALGGLGMAVGVAFMLGPALGATLLKDYDQAQITALFFTLLSGLFLLMLPTPKTKQAEESEGQEEKKGVEKSASQHVGLFSFLTLPAAQTPGARLLFFMRLNMALAFNVFMTVWTVSLKERFDFGPKGHAYFMGWVGLWYALSQGVLARLFIARAQEDPTEVLLFCVLGLSVGRVCAMLTSSLVLVYAIMAVVIVALGVMNTAMSSACSRLADKEQVGGLYGVMEAVESLAGLIGPTLGGVLFKLGPNVPLISVVIIYAAVFVAVFFFYRKHIVHKNADDDYKKQLKESEAAIAMMERKLAFGTKVLLTNASSSSSFPTIATEAFFHSSASTKSTESESTSEEEDEVLSSPEVSGTTPPPTTTTTTTTMLETKKDR